MRLTERHRQVRQEGRGPQRRDEVADLREQVRVLAERGGHDPDEVAAEARDRRPERPGR